MSFAVTVLPRRPWVLLTMPHRLDHPAADAAGGGLGVVDASTAASFVNGTMHVLPTAYSSLDTFVIAATDGGARVGSLAGNGGVYVVDLNLQ